MAARCTSRGWNVITSESATTRPEAVQRAAERWLTSPGRHFHGEGVIKPGGCPDARNNCLVYDALSGALRASPSLAILPGGDQTPDSPKKSRFQYITCGTLFYSTRVNETFLTMPLREKSSGGWHHAGRNFVAAQWRRVGLGCIVGALIGMGVHLLTRDSRFASFVHQEWAELVMTKRFDGFRAYKAEVVALCIGIFAIAVIPTLLWLRRYVHAWWAGITSATMLLATCATLTALTYAPNYPKATTAVGFASLAIVIMVEYWRQSRGVPLVAAPKPNIPTAKTNTSPEQRWQAPTSDDPIGDWDEDIAGRAAVVEVLADHAFRLRTPVVALHGDLGDGKSSVLNLLRRAVEGQAIVISFSAWLPGSEATLAADLFRDIAAECGRHVHVPQLRKRALAYARTVSGSVSYLAGLKELLPTQSQREEVQQLREALSRVPMPILVLVDEIDRMQKEELLVLLKILRGASSIPNVTFVCAFGEEEIKKELGSPSFDYLEKFFPVSVRLSAPDPDMLGACFQARLKMSFAEQKWFRTGQDAERFAGLLEQVWRDSLSKVCTNFRKAGLLLNDILTAARPIIGEVNPFDLTVIEAVRRCYPPIYRLVRTKRLLLTYGGVSLTKGEYLTQEHKKEERHTFLKILNTEIAKCPEPAVAQTLLSWLFPDYEAPSGEKRLFYASVRATSEDIAEDEKRICSGEYFPIYFRAAVPEEMFSNAELDRIVSDLREATKADVQTVFNRTLDSIPPKHPKTRRFLVETQSSIRPAR